MAYYEEFKSYYAHDSFILSKYPTQEAFNALIVNGKDFRYMDSAVEDYVKKWPKCLPRERICNQENNLLVVTDMQKAFGSKGPVAVPGAENSVQSINSIKPLFMYIVHSMDTHLEWSESFSINPNYRDTFFPHARNGTVDFEEFDDLDTCADAYFGKEQFSVTSNPKFKLFLLEKNITRVVFTGVAGDFCVHAGILGIIQDPDFLNIEVSLYQPGVQWVFPDTIPNQRSQLEQFPKFKWLKDESELNNYL